MPGQRVVNGGRRLQVWAEALCEVPGSHWPLGESRVDLISDDAGTAAPGILVRTPTSRRSEILPGLHATPKARRTNTSRAKIRVNLLHHAAR